MNTPNRQTSQFEIPATVNTAAGAQVIQQLIKSLCLHRCQQRDLRNLGVTARRQQLFLVFFFLLFEHIDFCFFEMADSPCARLPTQTGSHCLISDK